VQDQDVHRPHVFLCTYRHEGNLDVFDKLQCRSGCSGIAVRILVASLNPGNSIVDSKFWAILQDESGW
jgi:hypothetical protein